MVILHSYVSLPEDIWLVVYLPLWKMMEFVSWDDDIPNMMGKSLKKTWFQSRPSSYDDNMNNVGKTMP